MNYLTYSGNNLINAKLPDDAKILYAPPPIRGYSRTEIPDAVQQAFENPRGMEPLKELVDGNAKVLIAFDDNCQPFPATSRPDFRQLAIERLLQMLYSYGVDKKNINLVCAVALHRKMKQHELECMLGPTIMREFFPHQLENHDAEDPELMADLGVTDHDEPVEVYKPAIEANLVIYVDTIQIPLNGGHKSVGVGLSGYKTIACHHNPEKTRDIPHVMQPEGSCMHDSIERINRLIEGHCKVMVLEASMNNATYPFYFDYLGKPSDRCNFAEKILKAATPYNMAITPEPLRRTIMRNIRSVYEPFEIHAGRVEDVHPITVDAMRRQMTVEVDRQYDTLVFGLPDLSPYAIDARINPVLVVSDVLGYIFNWFYERPYIKPGGSVIVLNPTFEVFHEEYHVAYERFYNEVLPVTNDPFEMKKQFQEKFAADPDLKDAYRNRWAHHGFHPFTVWYWATYPLKYLSKVILVGPKDDRAARRLGVDWAPDLTDALAMAAKASGGDSVVAHTVPPFFYTTDTSLK
jgi:lactate racemase-like protein